MAQVLITETHLENIADAIREKLDVETTYKPEDMAEAIMSISSGYPEPTGTKIITANGTGIDVKDYANADVNVPNSYAVSDEGKVVDSGALVSQSSQTITQNGTYDTTLKNEVTVNVSGGSIPVILKADWDLLTIAEKRAYGLTVIQDYDSGFLRGRYVNGADYGFTPINDMTPVHSWNASNNSQHTYNFSGVAPSLLDTMFCMAVTSQNGQNAAWDASPRLAVLPNGEGIGGNGNYSVLYGSYVNGMQASTYSGGNNWNNSEIICFEFAGDVEPVIKEIFYEQGQTGTYTYSYQASNNENLLLVCMRGGSVGGAYSITGLTEKSHVTASGARFNDVYFGQVASGDTVDISIPYAAGANNNGSLFVVLMSVLCE